jgi:hypothetical protein
LLRDEQKLDWVEFVAAEGLVDAKLVAVVAAAAVDVVEPEVVVDDAAVAAAG